MYGIVLICLLLFGLASCLPAVQENNSNVVRNRKVESKEPDEQGMFEEIYEKVNKMSDTLERISNSGLDEKVNSMSVKLDSIYNSGLDKKVDGMSETLEEHEIKVDKMLERNDVKIDKISETLDELSDNNVQRHPSSASLRKAGHVKSGVYRINAEGHGPILAYCDMETDGGGWTVIQRRTSTEVDFFRTWADYCDFFGDIDGNFWLGLEAIHHLTIQQDVELYVKLQDFDNEDFDGKWYYARYRYFWLDSAASNYRINVHGYSGTAGDSLEYHNGRPFSTKDRNNDDAGSFNCALTYRGAWWYGFCGNSHLNGIYFYEKTIDMDSMNWKGIKPTYGSLKSSVMMIRPANF